MMTDLLLEHIPSVLGYLISAGFFTWILRDRKKQKSEQKSSEATALKDMQDVYDIFVKNTKEEIQSLQKELQELRGKVRELETRLSKYE